MKLSLFKKFIPPIAFDIWKRTHLNENLYYFGRFDTWEEALQESNRLGGDYEDQEIIERVEEATQKVRQGEALYEQDGVCYYEENNNWELIASLLYTKSMLGRISVLDMGGALGSTYFRYRSLLVDMEADWCVVEQKHFVDRGKEAIPEIDFYYSVDEAVTLGNMPNTLLLSSVLMYLNEPYKMLQDMLKKRFEYVIIDESAFFTKENAKDQIMLQHVPASIYEAVYPTHIFGLNKFRKFVNKCGYEIIWEWVYRGGQIQIKTNKGLKDTIDKGFLLKKVR
ncbi:MAG: methyltransferase, TIGR04325 family [Lachnospiraceae bacterium]|jgi:putative methyltransferase (TIGR04325 family)|nr:methyltransferase, TIGR04325 family [Lachnospiraceae bacterium]